MIRTGVDSSNTSRCQECESAKKSRRNQERTTRRKRLPTTGVAGKPRTRGEKMKANETDSRHSSARMSLCQLLQETTYLVFVLLDSNVGQPELISSGTAVAVNSRGDLLTAAHVVTTRLPVRAEDVHDPNLVILAKRKSGTFSRYSSPL